MVRGSGGSEMDQLSPGLWSLASPTHKAGETLREASNEESNLRPTLAQMEGVGRWELRQEGSGLGLDRPQTWVRLKPLGRMGPALKAQGPSRANDRRQSLKAFPQHNPDPTSRCRPCCPGTHSFALLPPQAHLAPTYYFPSRLSWAHLPMKALQDRALAHTHIHGPNNR